jgi:hypothetical protein
MWVVMSQGEVRVVILVLAYHRRIGVLHRCLLLSSILAY